MHNVKHLVLIVSALLVSPVILASAGCQRTDDQTSKKLDYLIGKVETLEKKLATAPVAGRGAPMGAPGAQPAGAPPARKRPDPTVTYFVPVTDADASTGPKAAKVTIVEAYEYACPYCAMLFGPMEEVARQHPDVRIVRKQFVVHPDTATLPALAACAANKQGKHHAFEAALWAKAWPMTDGKPNFARDQLAAGPLEQIAASVGLDVNRFKADRDGDFCKADLARQRGELAAIGVNGTPAIYINGKPYQGPRTPEAIGAAVDAARKEADALIARGQATVATAYDTMMKGAQKTL